MVSQNGTGMTRRVTLRGGPHSGRIIELPDEPAPVRFPAIPTPEACDTYDARTGEYQGSDQPAGSGRGMSAETDYPEIPYGTADVERCVPLSFDVYEAMCAEIDGFRWKLESLGYDPAALVAQWLERDTHNVPVSGSIPDKGTTVAELPTVSNSGVSGNSRP